MWLNNPKSKIPANNFADLVSIRIGVHTRIRSFRKSINKMYLLEIMEVRGEPWMIYSRRCRLVPTYCHCWAIWPWPGYWSTYSPATCMRWSTRQTTSDRCSAEPESSLQHPIQRRKMEEHGQNKRMTLIDGRSACKYTNQWRNTSRNYAAEKNSYSVANASGVFNFKWIWWFLALKKKKSRRIRCEQSIVWNAKTHK